MPASTAPRCFLCEDSIEPGEPFRMVQAYLRVTPSRTLPGNPGSGIRLVSRAVHYSCELEATAAAGVAGAGDDAPEMVVAGAEDEDLTTRDKLSRLMGTAIDLVDLVDEFLP
jgi:hypothetical protein